MKISKVKRIIGTALAAALTCSALTGCGMSFSAQNAFAPKEMTETATEEPDSYVSEEEYEEYTDAESYDAYDSLAEDNSLAYPMSEAYGCAAEEDGAYYAGETYEYDRSYDMKQDNEGSYLDGIYDYDNDERHEKEDNTEEYSELNEQGFRSVKSHPLSTFAADVDTASYANLRRMINSGYELGDFPEGSVRIEELLNYFDYDYEGPKKDEPFGVNTELSYCPWNDDALLLSIGLKTEDIDFSKTPPSNLVFLIDVSGSMADDDKLPLLQEAFCMLVDELSEKDRVSIVTYADGVETVLKGATGDEKRKIKKAINSLHPSGATNGGEGIMTAYKVAEKNFIKGGNNRIILATDGDLNLGITDVDDLHDLVSKKKESGVFLSVLGFGTGNIKDNRMETLADNGNGNYSYIDSVREARKVLVDELSSNMLTVCKDVKLQVEFDPEVVKGYRLLGYANRIMKDKDFDDDKKDGGEIGAGHEITVMYELIPTKEYDMYDIDDEDLSGSKLLTLSVRYKKPSGDKSSLLKYPVMLDTYEAKPSDEFLFKSAVCEFGLLSSDSLFSGNADIDNTLDRLESIRLNDEYKREFLDLVLSASGNSRYEVMQDTICYGEDE